MAVSMGANMMNTDFSLRIDQKIRPLGSSFDSGLQPARGCAAFKTRMGGIPSPWENFLSLREHRDCARRSAANDRLLMDAGVRTWPARFALRSRRDAT